MISGLHHIVLFCNDTSRSMQWYEQVGFAFKRGYEGMYWFALGDGEIMLHSGGGGRHEGGPTIHVAVTALDELFARVKQAALRPLDHQQPGVSLEAPVVRPWGDREFELQDPDGQWWAFAEASADA